MVQTTCNYINIDLSAEFDLNHVYSVHVFALYLYSAYRFISPTE